MHCFNAGIIFYVVGIENHVLEFIGGSYAQTIRQTPSHSIRDAL